MSRIERRQLESNIDYLIGVIDQHLDPAVSESVFQRHNVCGVWELTDNALLSVFEELDAIAADVN